MVRVLTWMAIILVCGMIYSTAEASTLSRRSQRKTTTTTTSTTKSPSILTSDESDEFIEDDEADRNYHPAEVTKPRVLEQVDQRFNDGNFEYKYVLSNGVARYEKSYYIPVDDTKALARKGYYSHPLPNGKYLTVFYTADENGFHQDSSTYSDRAPVLPRSLEVPHFEFPEVTSTSSTSTTRKPKQKKPSRKPKEI